MEKKLTQKRIKEILTDFCGYVLKDDDTYPTKEELINKYLTQSNFDKLRVKENNNLKN
jgi:hypothetical protein|tara:strand:+ start:12 stop:185 length:174 start_codon:yes stop_codon:yes gene_type:complete